MFFSELSVARWLDAHSDHSAGLATLPQGAILADIAGDGEHRLALLDIKLGKDSRSRLKVYKGTLLTADQTLPDVPSGIISFYTDPSDNKYPAVGIACGLDLLIYKNNKPFFKFVVPSLPISPLEVDIWSKLPDHVNQTVGKLVDNLKAVPYNTLTPRSQLLVNLPPEQYPEFIQNFKNLPLKRQSPITCVAVLQRSSHELTTPGCPIVATEAGHVYFLDPVNFQILHQASVCSTKASPCIMRTVGFFDVEFRLIIATREGHVTLLRRGYLEGKVLMHTVKDIIDMQIVPGDNFILLATSDQVLTCYTKRGNKLWSLEMKKPITCLCLIPLKHLSTSLVAVGMKDGAVQIYKGRHLVDHFSAADTPSVIIFGRMGQEEHVLVIITISGILNLKILKRTADFNLNKQDASLPLMQNKPLPLPKRSKLFLEQSARERQNAVEMHRNFQQDLIRLRLNAARAMAHSLSDSTGMGNEKEMVKVSAQVLGLGPNFTLVLNLENMNSNKPLLDLSIVFHVRPDLYKLSDYLIPLPLIPPGLTFRVETKVEELQPEMDANDNTNVQLEKDGQSLQHVKVFCVRKDQIAPIIAATINMPPTDITIPVL
ncbi:Bardet-Biedl syndrome 1 protein homolog isoform X2 [Atheta coriaria]|uniref:Bardet-Biedl syndrome 1 protein homolog isoform X2 n=1 Tax=Dalotia coriaria TaxID=877792 RepID=UPI0031F3EABF